MGNRTQQSIRYPSRYRDSDEKEKSLAMFVVTLRLYKNKLSKEEVKLCESIPGWKWETVYNWISKEEFIQWCKDNKIKGQKHFHSIKNRPDNIPSNPDKLYENFSWGDITGVYTNRDYVSKEEFIQWCKDNKILTFYDFRSIKNKHKPDNIPSVPQRIYKNWSWSDITGNYRNIDWVTKEEFIQWCKDNGVKNTKHFYSIKNNRPKNIPSNPQRIYENFSWGDITGVYIGRYIRTSHGK